MGDMARRWREAKLGERRGSRVCVWVECEGDPRAEVLEVLASVPRVVDMPEPDPDASLWATRPEWSFSGPPEAFGLPPVSGEPSDVVVTNVDRETGTITVEAAKPKRKRAKRGAE